MIRFKDLLQLTDDMEKIKSIIECNNDIERVREDYSEEVRCAGFMEVSQETLSGFILRCEENSIVV